MPAVKKIQKRKSKRVKKSQPKQRRSRTYRVSKSKAILCNSCECKCGGKKTASRKNASAKNKKNKNPSHSRKVARNSSNNNKGWLNGIKMIFALVQTCVVPMLSSTAGIDALFRLYQLTQL